MLIVFYSAQTSSEEDRCDLIVHLSNSILQELHGKTHRATLADIGLVHCADNDSHPHITFQRSDLEVISAEHNGVSGEVAKQDRIETDVFLLILSNLCNKDAMPNPSRRTGVTPEKWKKQFNTHEAQAPEGHQRVLPLPQVKMCFKLTRDPSVDLSRFSIPSTYEKKNKPSDINPQTWDLEELTFAPGRPIEAHKANSMTTHMLSSVPEHEGSRLSKHHMIEDDEPKPNKKQKITHGKSNGLPGPIQAAVYAASKLSASLATDHTLNSVIQGK